MIQSHAESMMGILGDLQYLPANQHSQSSLIPKGLGAAKNFNNQIILHTLVSKMFSFPSIFRFCVYLKPFLDFIIKPWNILSSEECRALQFRVLRFLRSSHCYGDPCQENINSILIHLKKVIQIIQRHFLRHQMKIKKAFR